MLKVRYSSSYGNRAAAVARSAQHCTPHPPPPGALRAGGLAFGTAVVPPCSLLKTATAAAPPCQVGSMGLSLFDGPTPIESFVFSQVPSGLNL